MQHNPGLLGYFPQDKDWVEVPSDKAFTVPYSELAMHVGYAGKKVTHVIVTPKCNYAFVRLEHGEWTHGLLNEVIPPSRNDWAKEIAWKE
jgi:hypothetical protein